MLAPKILGRNASHTMGSHRVLAFAADSDRTVMTGTGLCYTLNTT